MSGELKPIGWIIETRDNPPWFTLKPQLAVKHAKRKNVIVTAYYSPFRKENELLQTEKPAAPSEHETKVREK